MFLVNGLLSRATAKIVPAFVGVPPERMVNIDDGITVSCGIPRMCRRPVAAVAVWAAMKEPYGASEQCGTCSGKGMAGWSFCGVRSAAERYLRVRTGVLYVICTVRFECFLQGETFGDTGLIKTIRIMKEKQEEKQGCGCGCDLKEEVDRLVKDGRKPTVEERLEKKREVEAAFGRDGERK